ncbi:hypothetical protein BDW74DRAFT_184850 [Aspergillus multicolor]|uniref:F-box protein n=1 Tax=Aspergillus multicolor TaxID=41759 RepID=UPI003CCD1037
MAPGLPYELLVEIAKHLQDCGGSLVPCTRVSRQWQAAFEPLLYSTLHVYSDDGQNEEASLSLAQFSAATSGSGQIPREYMRHITYHIIIPANLPNWQGKRRWLSIRRHCTIHRALFGREAGSEPLTDKYDDTGEYSWDFKRGRTKALPVYRARLAEKAIIPDVSCIDCLYFPDQYESDYDHRIWAGAVMEIVRHCPTLTQLQPSFDEYIRPDHLEYIQARRQAVSDGLRALPSSLRVLNFSNQDEEPWKTRLPGLNVLSTSIDTLSANLGHLSLSLGHPRLYHVSLAPNFLFPLDDNGNPQADSASLHWPYLETLHFDQVPPRSPSGQWLVHPTPAELIEIHHLEGHWDWERIVCDPEGGNICRTVIEADHFHRLLISLGHAARRMPRLQHIKFLLNFGECPFGLAFSTPAGGGGAGAKWHCKYHTSYAPDSRVAAAWGYPLIELDAEAEDWISFRKLNVLIPSRPPT